MKEQLTTEEQRQMDSRFERDGRLPNQSFHIEDRGGEEKPKQMGDPSHVPMFRTRKGFKVYRGWREDEGV